MTNGTEHEGGQVGGDKPDTQDDGGLDPVIVAVLACLRDALTETPGRAWSLAKLSKRSQVPMSTLRRTLTQLDGAGLTHTEIGEDGIGHVILSDEGVALADALFSEGGGGPAGG
ncbi:ArsR family transcriptional regulator [Burkholderia sp. 22PA0099]|uniref:ArsR family transcriptional regulator n=1 Tax=Burkholderia sp. 22PA0099 TaxID=3237372 RepID=UPI0039C14A81